MKSNILALVTGFVFAIGLGVSGMTAPSKVLAFLNLAGDWSPALILVMGAAVTVSAISYLLIRNMRKPIFENKFEIPSGSPITRALIAGAVVFGTGWGLAGYCPGPAVVSVVALQTSTIIFTISMLIGMFAFRIFDQKRSRI
jgi:uncharacterized protein